MAERRSVEPAAQLDGALIQKTPEPKCRGLFYAGEVALLMGEPGQFGVGDDTGRDGSEEKLANRHGLCYGT